MQLRRSNEIVNHLVKEAQRIGPRDPLTLGAYLINGGLRLILFPINLVLVPPCTFILGIGVMITFSALLLLLSAIWFPLLGIILGSSWLWLRAPISRPVLILPGVIVAVVSDVYVSLVPDMGEKYQKLLKLGICDSWPYSLIVFQLNLKEVQPETE